MKIGHIVNKIPLVKQNKSAPQLIDSNTLLGVEIEVESYLKPYDIGHTYAGYWTAKEDNSLRNHGMEMVFAEPLSGIDVINAITWLFEQATLKGWKISKLTGAHVHVDIRDLELDQFKNFCAVYALTEPLIYNWVGRSRFENMFCLPWHTAEADLKSIAKVAREGEADPKRAKTFLEGLSKYSGLNLNAAYKFGTAEFRMLETTFDLARFIDWLNILLSLKMYAVQTGITPETMCDRIKKHGAWAFGHQVFGLNLITKMWYSDYDTDVVGLGMPTCDWFLDNVKDLQLKGKPPGEQLNWIRITRLSNNSDDSLKGTHKGFERFKEKTTSFKPAKRSLSSKKLPPPHLGINTATWDAIVNGPASIPSTDLSFSDDDPLEGT